MNVKWMWSEYFGIRTQWIMFLFTLTWTCFVRSDVVKSSAESTRIKRYLQSELVPISRTCIVYDETLSNRVLTDESTGAICTLLSVNKLLAEASSLSVTTKIISAGNPLAHYFAIQPQNYSLVTTQRIDREDLCSLTPNEQTISDALIRCCNGRKRECELPLTVLIQISRPSGVEAKATDGSNEKQSRFMRLVIRLIDVNDNPPRFPSARHQVVVSEGIRVGTRFTLPLAQDIDSSDYGIARYYLLSQDDDTFELEQTAPISTDLKQGSNDQSLEGSYSDVAFPAGSPNNYFGSKSFFHENPSVDLAPKQLYLKLARPLDWETKQNYAYVIVAEDNGTPALTGQLQVQVVVTDENDNHPIFQNKTFTLSVSENSPKGTRLIQLVAHDPDQGKAGQISYSLALEPGSNFNQPFTSHSNTALSSHFLSNSPDKSTSQLFTVDSHSGWLILNGLLDYERNKHHLVRVLAKDEGGHPGFDEATINILVTDVNDVAPTISVDPVTDLLPPESSKPKVINIDHSNNLLNLYVNETPWWTGPAGSRHNGVDGNPVTVTAPMLLAFVAVRDPDTGRGGEFVCGLTQTASTEKETESQPSRFYLYADQIGTGNQIFPVRPDEVDRNGPSVVGHFKLNPISTTQFELSSFDGFDHEKAATEELQIVCVDFGQPPLVSRFTVRIHVADLNDNAPRFTKKNYQLNVEENRPVGTILERFRATDIDSGRNAEIEYFLDNSGSEFFRVDSKDGTLYTKVSFDRELRQNYRLQVFAKDHGSPTALTSTATVEIDITDLNDNSPEFVGLDNENSYKFRIAENEPANSHVGILLGMDNDAKDNARLKFRLVTSSGSFKLDSNTGELTTLHSLDREKQAQYELIAMLMDHGSPTRSATAKVVVYVSDVNDHDPIVVFPANGRGNVTVSFREPPGEVVARIEARDPDEGHNALLHYSLVGGNRNSIFRLGSTSAELIVNHQLSEADVDIYPLEVLVQDAGIPPRSAQVKLTVKVTDSPARVYPHRLTNIQQKLKDAANQQPGESLPSVGHFRHSEGIHSNQNSLDQRQAELPGSDNGLVSAGAILVAIVALSCAIILVLLGITVYLCGHKGLGIRRRRDHNRTRQAGSGNGSSLNVNTITAISNNELTSSLIDPMKRGKQTTKEMEPERLNTSQMNYSDPILIDPGNGTLLRYQFGPVQGVSEPNEHDYGDQNLLCMNSPISYEAYTTCLPMNERVPISGTYEAIPAGRILFPITSGGFGGTNGTKVMVNNGEFLHPKFTTESLIKPKFRQISRGIIQTGKREKKPKRSYCDDRQFTQSLKLKRSNWINVCDSPVSEGSGTAAGELKSASLVQPRAAKSWETLVVVNTRPRVEFVPESLGANKRVQESNDNVISSFTEPFTSESASKASWTTVIHPGASVLQPSVSTFLRDKSHVCCTPRRNPPGSSYSSNPATADSLTSTVNQVPLTEVHQDSSGYSRLCRSTQLAACSLHSPNPTGLNTATESSFSHQGTHMKRQTMEMSSKKRSTKSDNLIELTDSSQASTCSQSCECALSSTENQCPSMQPFTVLPPYNEQSEFV